jgi:hypothetical protein
LVPSTSARLIALSSASSTIHLPRKSCAASLVPTALISSVNQSGFGTRAAKADDLPPPCGPSSTSAQSALQPGR